jgi:hypothetical protein
LDQVCVAIKHPRHILDDGHPWPEQPNDPECLVHKLVAVIAVAHLARAGKTLARRASDQEIDFMFLAAGPLAKPRIRKSVANVTSAHPAIQVLAKA